jgi:hypothetical protein
MIETSERLTIKKEELVEKLANVWGMMNDSFMSKELQGADEELSLQSMYDIYIDVQKALCSFIAYVSCTSVTPSCPSCLKFMNRAEEVLSVLGRTYRPFRSKWHGRLVAKNFDKELFVKDHNNLIKESDTIKINLITTEIRAFRMSIFG